MGVEQAAVFLARVRGEKLMTSQLLQVDQFPDRWFGYEGVDVVILSTGEVNPAEKLSDEQFTALLRWLQLGGRLVYSAGRRAPELFRESHPFFPLRPGTWEEIDKYWKASGLENLTRAAERLTSNDESPLAVFKDLRGTVTCFEGTGGANDRALVVQYPVGFGEVTYVALDLEQAPLAQWPARPRLIARLLQTRSEEEDSAIGSEGLGQVTHLGYDDIAGQLRSALDQYSHVTLVRFSWIAGILVLYILLLGPLDFFGLHRLGRPHWTWVTFPLTVIAFCLLAIWLSQRWKGNRVEVNQMDVVDVDLAQGTVRGTTWANVYSPQRHAIGLGPGSSAGRVSHATARRVAVVERSAWCGTGWHELDGRRGRAGRQIHLHHPIRIHGGEPAAGRRDRTAHPDIGDQRVDCTLVVDDDGAQAQRPARVRRRHADRCRGESVGRGTVPLPRLLSRTGRIPWKGGWARANRANWNSSRRWISSGS